MVHAGDLPRVRAAFEAARSGDGAWFVEHRVVHADGAVRHLVSRGRFTFDGAGAARQAVRLVGALLDVTAERDAEVALRESETRFRHLADSIPQLAWIADADGSIGWYNDRWYAYTGTDLEQMKGWGWQIVHHPDHVEAVTDKFRTSIASGEPWEDTFPLRGADGVYRWFLSRAHPIHDADGRVLRWFGTNTDITEQRAAAAALRDLNEALEARVAERTAALAAANVQLEARNRELQDFAHVASHDLQEPLRKIQSFASLLATEYTDELGGDGRHYVARAQAAAERMSGLIRDLLAFSRVATTQHPATPVDLDAVLAAVLVDLDVRVAQTGGVVESGDPRHHRRRRGADAAAVPEPRRQCPQVPPRRRAPRRARDGRADGGCRAPDRGRQRHRVRAEARGPHFRSLPAPPRQARVRGHRHGPRHRAPHRRAPRRHRRRRKRAGRGQPIRRHAAGGVRLCAIARAARPQRESRKPLLCKDLRLLVRGADGTRTRDLRRDRAAF